MIQKDIREMLQCCGAVKRLRGSSVLITGATGYIGSYLIHALMLDAAQYQADTKIYALVRSAARARTMFGGYEAAGRLELIEQDVCVPLTAEFDVDYLIHCASNAAPKEYSEDPVGTMNTNFGGTANLLNYAREHVRKRFLYVSTIEIYGAAYAENPAIHENEYGIIDSCNPRSCYPLSKKACETLAISYGKQYGVPVSIGRLAYIYGPGMRPDDSKVAAMFPREIAAGRNIVMKSTGAQRRSYCYVSDAISGLFTILAYGENQQAYNVASEIGITTICHMAQRLTELFPEKGLHVIFDLPTEREKQAFSFIADAVLDSQKLEALGWKPLTDLDTGLKNTVLNEEAMLGA